MELTERRHEPGMPYLGWRCRDVIDLREQGLEYGEYWDCEMCGHEQIRYVHVMEYDDYDGVVRVGCVCAGRMQQDPEGAKRDDIDARNRSKRYGNFRRQRWLRATKGMEMRYKGMTIEASITNGAATLTCLGETVDEYHGRPINTEDRLWNAAFELLERMLHKRRDAQAIGGCRD